jgi:hypothetical protein
MCSICREPLRREYTICTARAPEDVFTVRICGDTSPPQETRLVPQSRHPREQTRRSTNRDRVRPHRVIKVR